MATLGALSVAHTPTTSHPSSPLEFTRFCSVSYSSRYLRSPLSLALSPRSRGCSSERVEVSSSVFEIDLKGCGYGVRRGRMIQRTLVYDGDLLYFTFLQIQLAMVFEFNDKVCLVPLVCDLVSFLVRVLYVPLQLKTAKPLLRVEKVQLRYGCHG